MTQATQYFAQDFVDVWFSLGETLSIGLFNGNTDSIGYGSTMSNITTEPSNGGYSRVSTISTDWTPANVSGANGYEYGPVTFDVSGTSGIVDYYFVESGGELLWVAPITETKDLTKIENLIIKTVGFRVNTY
jgi:hypothetical protein